MVSVITDEGVTVLWPNHLFVFIPRVTLGQFSEPPGGIPFMIKGSGRKVVCPRTARCRYLDYELNPTYEERFSVGWSIVYFSSFHFDFMKLNLLFFVWKVPSHYSTLWFSLRW